ncbi:MAG: helix-turn-helix transcriptional regulator [Deltaproteobacteria bacterium]|nr:helix-turn-helix transcriptional regulator [Deltaproteobacteria bacterium]
MKSEQRAPSEQNEQPQQLTQKQLTQTQLTQSAEAGELLKARRRAQGVTQELLADYSGVSRVSITKIERGGDLRLSTLLRLTQLLGLEVIIKPRDAR